MVGSRNRGLLGLVMLSVIAFGCGGTRTARDQTTISHAQALELAVAIANEECMEKFSMAPFDRTSSTVEFKNGRWRWGGLDLAGRAGLSAAVSFDGQGKDRRAEVYLSTDQLQGTVR